ncbi:MAG: hypothetical protein SPH49_00075, partial [Dialister sp.]|nr:hypothetical protein [Dialister sp.]
EKLEMRNAKWWCGAKNNEAPQNFDSASRCCHLERSRGFSLQNGQCANCAISITSCFPFLILTGSTGSKGAKGSTGNVAASPQIYSRQSRHIPR